MVPGKFLTTPRTYGAAPAGAGSKTPGAEAIVTRVAPRVSSRWLLPNVALPTFSPPALGISICTAPAPAASGAPFRVHCNPAARGSVGGITGSVTALTIGFGSVVAATVTQC